MKDIQIFIGRLNKIGIKVELSLNYPWVYITKINGKRVKEVYKAEHGFTLGFMSTPNNDTFRFTDMKQIFKLIRKYTKCHIRRIICKKN